MVGDGGGDVTGLRVDGDRDVDRGPSAVDHRVVEQRPQDLVELVGVREGEPARRAVLDGEWDVGDAERLPRPANAGPGREHLDARTQRARLDPAHRQQLADHPRQAVRLLGDDPEAPVGRVRGQLLRIAADARERRLEVVRDAAQEVVLRLVEVPQAPVLVLHPRVQLRVPDRRRHLDREQLQQVLVGALPVAGGREMADDDPDRLAGRDEVRSDGHRIPGNDLLGGDLAGIDEQELAVDHPEGAPGLCGRTADDDLGTLGQAGGLERDDDLAQLPVASPQVPGEAVVAFGEAAELVVSGQLQAAGVLACRDLLHGSRDGPQRGAQVGREERGQQDGEHDRDGHREQQHPGDGGVGPRGAGHDQDHDAEAGHWQDGGRDQRERETGPEPETRPAVDRGPIDRPPVVVGGGLGRPARRVDA